MAKEKRHGIIFDSGWEADYWDLCVEQKERFTYHPDKVKVSDFNYEPDFLKFKDGIVELVEIKATYNPWSATKDRMLDNALKMLVKHSQDYLLEYVRKYYPNATSVKYSKIKYLVKHGFVPFSFKSPTRYSELKIKHTDLIQEHKDIKNDLKISKRDHKKDLEDIQRLLNYLAKDKLTITQRRIRDELLDKFKEEL
jgi:hypothetical protein